MTKCKVDGEFDGINCNVVCMCSIQGSMLRDEVIAAATMLEYFTVHLMI